VAIFAADSFNVNCAKA